MINKIKNTYCDKNEKQETSIERRTSQLNKENSKLKALWDHLKRSKSEDERIQSRINEANAENEALLKPFEEAKERLKKSKPEDARFGEFDYYKFDGYNLIKIDLNTEDFRGADLLI
jgi:predicted RNase H-like nuclease (RuvC/YqgF family)